MDLVIPLAAVPAQTLSIELGGQQCRLVVRQKATGLYVDLYVNDALILGGRVARNLDRLVRAAYLGFKGDMAFFDTAGKSDPTYDGLGSRYVLLYSLG
jgi:hypothetical protein